MHVGRYVWVGVAAFLKTIILPNIAHASGFTREFEGPVIAHVDRVIDGDTFEASALIWLGQQVSVRVRILGIDAPELRAHCDSERARAEAARAWLDRRIAGAEVRLSAIRTDKYGGRVDASVTDAHGDIGDSIVRAGLARLYDGGHRDGWCSQHDNLSRERERDAKT